VASIADWPQDPRLDPFRNAVWELSRGGRVVAHLTCRVVPVRRGWAKREVVWYQVIWLDGRRERLQADSGPVWSVVADLERGRFEVLDIGDQVLDARPLASAERDALWQRYGPPG
jgi:hypothetical protein